MLGVDATRIVICGDRGSRRCDKRPLTDSGRVKRCALRQALLVKKAKKWPTLELFWRSPP